MGNTAPSGFYRFYSHLGYTVLLMYMTCIFDGELALEKLC